MSAARAGPPPPGPEKARVARIERGGSVAGVADALDEKAGEQVAQAVELLDPELARSDVAQAEAAVAQQAALIEKQEAEQPKLFTFGNLVFDLTRREVNTEGWIKREYLNNALRELKLEKYWTPEDANGNPIKA